MFRVHRMTSPAPPVVLVCCWLVWAAFAAHAEGEDVAKDVSAPPTAMTGLQEMDAIYDHPKLLVILIDGLRWDAINTSHVTTAGCGGEEGILCQDPASFFTSVQREGVTAAWNSPVYPTLPLHNLYTIATGTLPAVHGVVEEGDSPAVPPLWTTAASQGKKTAVLRWTSCPTEPVPLLTCADPAPLAGTDNLLVQLVGDGALAADMIVTGNYSLVMMRTELISWASEHYGPSSDEVHRLVEELKIVLDNLFKDLQDNSDWEQLSVVLVSTTGLADTSPALSSPLPLATCLQGLAPTPRIRFISAGSVLLAPANNTKQLIEKLETCEDLVPDVVSWYKLSDLPEVDRLHGGDDEVLVVAQPGYRLVMDTEEPSAADYIHSEDGRLQLARAEAQPSKGRLAGAGYETHLTDISGILIAKGPGLQISSTGASVVQTDVYQLLCRQLQLAPEPHHGHWQAVSWMMQTSEASGHPKQFCFCSSIGIATMVIIAYLLGR